MEFDREKIWWFDALNDRFYKDANITKFNLGRKLFNKRAITYLSIDDNEVEAVIFDGRKNYYESSIIFSQLEYSQAELVKSILKNNMDMAIDLINGVFNKELNRMLVETNIDIIPGWNNIKYSCSCRKAKKCEHISTVLHRLFNETIFEPMLIFELRGIKCSDIFSFILNDPDYELISIKFPEELDIDYYEVKSAGTDILDIDPQNYYGTVTPDLNFKTLKPSILTKSKIFHGKIRDEYYEIYDTLSDLLKINSKKY